MAIDPEQKRQVLTAVALGSFPAPFMVSALIVSLPAIGIEFSSDAASISWLGTIFFLVAGVCLIPFGRLADILGVRRLFSIGVVIYLFAAIISALAPSAWLLMAGRAVAGIGAGMVFGTSLAFISLVFPEKERGKAIGITVTSLMAGFSFGSVLGGFITFYLSWRLIFVPVMVVAALALFVLHRRVTVECALASARTIDRAGIGLYVPAMLLLLLGASFLPSPMAIGMLITGGLLLAVFVIHNGQSTSPMLDPGLFSRPGFLGAVAAALLFYTGTFAPSFLFSLYLQVARDLDPRSAGLVLVLNPVAMALLSPLAGRLADRRSVRPVASVGAGLSIAGLLPLLVLTEMTPLPFVAVVLLLLGAGVAFFATPVVKRVIGAVEREAYAVASSTVETMRLVGMTLSMACTTIAFTLLLANQTIAGTGPVPLIRMIHGISLLYLALVIGALLLLRISTE